LLGREKGPTGLPDDEAGTAVVVSYLQTHNLLSPGVRVLDGSGLSRLDRTTVAALQGVAENMSEHDDGIYFLDSLPEPGEDGTLRRRLWGVQVRAKSGSLATSKSLTGYVTTAGGRRLSFSIVYNGPAGSAGAISQIDEMIAAIAQSDAP
jgi:D-alanyl-D-alanine carboxypeptidase/D-alanyl-D-alanine-endopeptidase (penicillin-binding protein 4)